MGLLILLALGLVLAWGLMVMYTAWVLSHPARRTYGFAVARNLPGDPSEVVIGEGGIRGLEFTSWAFRSRGRELPVWDVRGFCAAGPVFILTHGWGDSRVMMLGRAAALAPLASRLILWDLPAHGDSPRGGFTLAVREHDDLIALVDTVAGAGLEGRGIVLYGASLGAGSAIVAAARIAERPRPAFVNPVVAVIAEAPYRLPWVPARNVFRVRGMPYRTTLRPAIALLGLAFGRGLAWTFSKDAGGFDVALHAAKLPASVPLLVIHGDVDPVCPVEDGRAIAAAAPKGTFVDIAGAAHNNLWAEDGFSKQCLDAIGGLVADGRSTMDDGRA